MNRSILPNGRMTPTQFKAIRQRTELYVPTDDTKLAARFWVKVDRKEEEQCWPWLGKRYEGRQHPNPYGAFYLAGKFKRAHRVALVLATGQQLTPGLVVLHSCDNPICVNPAHLREGTQQENRRQTIARNRHDDRSGIRNTNTKLTERQVLAIKKATISVRDIAELVGVSPATIRCIRDGRTWRDTK